MEFSQYAGRDVNIAGHDININHVYSTAKVESLIADVINNLSNYKLPLPFQNKKNKLPVDVEEKIKLNNIKKSRNIIESYKPLSSYLNSVYADIEKVRISAKGKVLQRLQNAYINELNKYMDEDVEPIDIVRANADIIFLGIKEQIKNIVFSAINNHSTEEDVDIALNVILADAFVSCQIMESEDK